MSHWEMLIEKLAGPRFLHGCAPLASNEHRSVKLLLAAALAYGVFGRDR